jgi:general secretion pathway protein H
MLTYSHSHYPARGFTMIELIAAITIGAMMLALAVPASVKMYETMQYRGAVKDAVTLLASARYKAIDSGRAQDVRIKPDEREMQLNDTTETLPKNLTVAVTSARELNQRGVGVIRFYPEGGSSGGGIDIERENGGGVRISVDWLIGRVFQERYNSE